MRLDKGKALSLTFGVVILLTGCGSHSSVAAKASSANNAVSSNSTASKPVQPPTMSLLSDVKQYGGATFDPKSTMGNTPSVSEQNGTVYVSGFNNQTDSQGNLQVEVSVGQNGKWVVTDKTITLPNTSMPDVYGGGGSAVWIRGRDIFYENDNENTHNSYVFLVTIDASGNASAPQALYQGPSPNTQLTSVFPTSTGGYAIALYLSNETQIITDDGKTLNVQLPNGLRLPITEFWMKKTSCYLRRKITTGMSLNLTSQLVSHSLIQMDRFY